jgi:hypothetical protein
MAVASRGRVRGAGRDSAEAWATGSTVRYFGLGISDRVLFNGPARRVPVAASG